MKERWQAKAKQICRQSQKVAYERQTQLTKPPGSLGRLEQLAIDFCGWQGSPLPRLTKTVVRVFAADHGVVAEDVSAFPQAVTAEMIRNFCRGGAAITVLARQHNADFAVINLGTAEAVADMSGLTNCEVARGSGNIATEPAMTREQLFQAMMVGADSIPESTDLFVGGEMGIGNTTVAAALCCALLSQPAGNMVGRGTGIDDRGLKRKISAVEKALQLHQHHCDTAFECLRRLGGLEIAALTGAYIQCAQQGVPALVDGYIASAAALVAVRINPSVAQWLLFAHHSSEPGHQRILKALKVEPLLDFRLRLGEGSGAALVLPLLQSALKLHTEMATFAEAGVSSGP